MIEPSSLTGATSQHDDLVAAALEEFLQLFEAGQAPDPYAFAARFPSVEQTLIKALAGLTFIEGAARGIESSSAGMDSFLAGGLAAQHPLGDFRLVRELGRGGMGIVYEAEQLSLGRRVALKVLPLAAVLDPRQLQRFKNEAMTAAHLDHPNIVEVYGVGCERSVHFYAMRYIEGVTLAEVTEAIRTKSTAAIVRGSATPQAAVRSVTAQPVPAQPDLSANRCFPRPREHVESDAKTSPILQAALQTVTSGSDQERFRRSAQLGIQAAEALHYAHQMGIVHRDIKPSNLMLDERGKLWVTDFGLAKLEQNGTLTATGDLVGTLRYMSPEQAAGKSPVLDHRTDIYSLGMSLYELLTLRPAFAKSDRSDLFHQILNEDPPPPRKLNHEIPAELETIVLKAISKEASERYCTAQELADDLRRFTQGLSPQARVPSRVKRATRWLRRHRRVALAAGLLFALSVVGLAFVGVLIAYQRNEAIRQRDRYEQLRHEAEANFRSALHVLTLIAARENDSHRLASTEISKLRSAQSKTVIEFLSRFVEDSADADKRLQTGLAHVHIGRIYAAMNNAPLAQLEYEQAVNTFGLLVAEYPDEMLYCTELGVAETITACHLHRHSPGPISAQHFRIAQQCYRKSLGQERRALICLAWQQINCPVSELRDPEEAEKLANQLIDQSLKGAQRVGYFLRGASRYRQGKLRLALADLNESERLNDDNNTFDSSYTEFFRALSLRQLGQLPAAQACFARGRELLKAGAEVEDDFGIRWEARRAFSEEPNL